MRGTSRSFTAPAGDLALVASLVLLVPSWMGGVEALAAMGFDNTTAAVLGGVYAWGRGGISAALLARRYRRGTLDLGGAWLRAALPAAGRAPLASSPVPAVHGRSLSRSAAAASMPA